MWKTTLGFFLESRQKKIENNGVAYRQKTELSSPEVTVATEPLECGDRKMSCVASVKYTPDFKGLIKSVTCFLFLLKLWLLENLKLHMWLTLNFYRVALGQKEEICVYLRKTERVVHKKYLQKTFFS